MNSGDIALSECGRFLTIMLPEHWDMPFLKGVVLQARGMEKIHGINKILIATDSWLNTSMSMEVIFSIGDVFMRMVDSNWKIAVVTPGSNNQNKLLEEILSLRGIKLQHFDYMDKAEGWLATA